jgi:hypothetical protein
VEETAEQHLVAEVETYKVVEMLEALVQIVLVEVLL